MSDSLYAYCLTCGKTYWHIMHLAATYTTGKDTKDE